MKKCVRIVSVMLVMAITMSLSAVAAPTIGGNASTYANQRVPTGRVLHEEESESLIGTTAVAVATLVCYYLKIPAAKTAIVQAITGFMTSGQPTVYYTCDFTEYYVSDPVGNFLYYEYVGKLKLYKDPYHTLQHGSTTTVTRQAISPMILPISE